MIELLKEYIESILVEKIRTGHGWADEDPFDMMFFKDISQNHNIPKEKMFRLLNRYATDRLKSLGIGSSRKAFLLSSKKVLKIAKNDKGLAQNEAELDVFTDPITKKIVSSIYEFDPNHYWLISELVRPIYRGEFHDTFRVTFKEFFSKVEKYAGMIESGENVQPKEKINQIAYAAAELIAKLNLIPADLEEPEHWGKTADGRIVILDYGYNVAVYEKHYAA